MSRFANLASWTTSRVATRAIIVFMLLAVSACGNDQGAPETVPDLVFFNGTVYTVDEQRSSAEAVAVTDGLITFVGKQAEATYGH